jgi:hypothetical protein
LRLALPLTEACVNLLIIIISLLMSPLLGHRPPYGLHIRRTGHHSPRGPSAGWWVNPLINYDNYFIYSFSKNDKIAHEQVGPKINSIECQP